MKPTSALMLGFAVVVVIFYFISRGFGKVPQA